MVECKYLGIVGSETVNISLWSVFVPSLSDRVPLALCK